MINSGRHLLWMLPHDQRSLQSAPRFLAPGIIDFHPAEHVSRFANRDIADHADNCFPFAVLSALRVCARSAMAFPVAPLSALSPLISS